MTKRTLLALALLCPSLALAWGKEGHAVVAQIADDYLSPQARAQVSRLLALEPGATLESISSWADEHRNPETGKWHYVNFRRGSGFEYSAADCPGDACLVPAIARQEAILRDTSSSDLDRLTALKYIVHLVGDVHQPLHAGYADDKGGNTYQVRWDGRGSNLHHVWDTGLIDTFNMEPLALARRLEYTQRVTAGGTPVDWVQESGRIVGSSGFYPDREIPASYVETWRPVVETRLTQAGVRLAETLNRDLQ